MMTTTGSRTANSIRNMKYAICGQVFSVILSFVSRTVFVYILGKEYLGINGLFSNILAILALAEMGIGSAIIYSLYKPLAENNEELTAGLMRLFRKIYTGIGLFILIIGCFLTPFLDFFVKERPNVPYFELIYVLFVVNNASGYFFSYKGMLINADQKQYITTTITQLSTLLMNVIQIICLVLTHNYILYLLIMLLSTLGRNIVISVVANRLFPFITTKKNVELPIDEKNTIIKNVKAMMMHKIGGVIVDSTDNILLSKIVSVAVVGLYSNYYLITHTITTLYSMLFNALVASVGNLGVTNDKETIYKNFRIIDFAGSWLYYFSFICLLNLLDPFISLWLGKDYMFGYGLTFVICINFYFTGMRNGLLTFRSALGLFWYDRYKAIAEAVVNLIVSIVLGLRFGAIGIFIGTATSTICVCLLIEPYVVYKYAFDRYPIDYYRRYIANLMLTLIVGCGMRRIIEMCTYEGILKLIISIIICATVPNIIYFLIFGRTTECNQILYLIRKRVRFL